VTFTLNQESKEAGKAWATKIEVVLRNGQRLANEGNGFRGSPDTPMSEAELDAIFLMLASSLGEARSRPCLNG
jgi:hypothetical protein